METISFSEHGALMVFIQAQSWYSCQPVSPQVETNQINISCALYW